MIARTLTAATLAATLIAGQAQALSCIRPDVARSYTEAADTTVPYIVILGTLTHSSGPLPERDLTDPDPEEQSFPARFSGKALDSSGFGTDFSTRLTLELGCAGPWCAGLPDRSGEILAFVERRDSGYVLRMGPCGGNFFPVPTGVMINKVEACHTGGDCTPLN